MNMKAIFKSVLTIGVALSICLASYFTAFAKTTTVESASFTHGGETGSYCSMVTQAEIKSTETSLVSFYYKKGTSLGYSFSLQASPENKHYNGYDVYVTNNQLLWMNGSKSWNFTLTTTHTYP